MPIGEVEALIVAWLKDLFGPDSRAAIEFAESPETSLAGFNLSASDLTSDNVREAAESVSNSGQLSAHGQSTLHSFAGSQSSGHSPVHEVATVTKVIHHNNPAVTNVFNDNRTFVDQSSDFVNTGIIGGDVSIDSHDVTATDGAVVGTGNANVTAATGDGAVANQGGTVNQADDGSQVIDDSIVGQNQNNSDGAVQAGQDASGVNTGVNTGVNSGGNAEDNVVGDGNATANVDGGAEGAAIGFGSGDTSAATGNEISGDGALASGGDAANVSDVAADNGSAVSADDASGQSLESTETNVLGSQNTQVVEDQSAAEASQDTQQLDTSIDDSVIIDDAPVDA